MWWVVGAVVLAVYGGFVLLIAGFCAMNGDPDGGDDA